MRYILVISRSLRTKNKEQKNFMIVLSSLEKVGLPKIFVLFRSEYRMMKIVTKSFAKGPLLCIKISKYQINLKESIEACVCRNKIQNNSAKSSTWL